MFIYIGIVCFSKKVNSHFSHMCPEELKDFLSSGSIFFFNGLRFKHYTSHMQASPLKTHDGQQTATSELE